MPMDTETETETETDTEAKKDIAADSKKDCYFEYMLDMVGAQKEWLECERMVWEGEENDQP
jgi:hypothetical protein